MRRVAVIGAGAAGTMAAIFATSAGAQTLLLERTRDGGRKILISGGGRCNVLPARVDESRFVTDSSPHTLHKMVRSWPLPEQIAFFEGELGLPLVEEEASAKLFPASHRARDVRDGLVALAVRRGVNLLMNTVVTGFAPSGAGWRIDRKGAPPLEADAVIVATGGLSVPNTGSDGLGLQVVERLGHTVHPTYAALTPITSEAPLFAALAGVSLRVTLTACAAGRTAVATGGFLFTHRGYSGPAVLDVSHVAVRSRAEKASRARLFVRWTRLGEKEWELALRPRGSRTVAGALRTELPDRLVSALLDGAHVDPARALSDLRREERLRVIETLVRGELPWTGDEGYAKAEVTGGGVRLSEVDPKTMESRKHPGLFLCGEMLDAFGPIGGYNFLWAWATGRAAGLGAAC
ncbi:MAG: aminoacetone oxidase family FAD-binding enzyme [Candidatus Latescibacteria bacterium]|nr:aminoacetone oxidase family FAD-binding enzyme [Candidatus Latescibacterota bacterium]